jgi:hypothetical protein
MVLASGQSYGGEVRFLTGGVNTVPSQKMVIVSSGNVGIGDANPTIARLQVGAGVSDTRTLIQWASDTTVQVSSNRARNISIYAANWVWSDNGFAVNSDLRIKKDISDIHDDCALNDVRRLQPKTYGYIDKYSRGTNRVYGFIAQEVGEVLPYAVSLERQMIPNIYDRAYCSPLEDISGTLITLQTKPAVFDLSQIDVCGNYILHPTIYILDKQNARIESKLVDILDSNSFTIESTLSNDEYFVLGQEVTDFNTLNKEAIFTVNVAATQEIDRQLQSAKQRIQTLEDTLSNAMSRLEALENMYVIQE